MSHQVIPTNLAAGAAAVTLSANEGSFAPARLAQGAAAEPLEAGSSLFVLIDAVGGSNAIKSSMKFVGARTGDHIGSRFLLVHAPGVKAFRDVSGTKKYVGDSNATNLANGVAKAPCRRAGFLANCVKTCLVSYSKITVANFSGPAHRIQSVVADSPLSHDAELCGYQLARNARAKQTMFPYSYAMRVDGVGALAAPILQYYEETHEFSLNTAGFTDLETQATVTGEEVSATSASAVAPTVKAFPADNVDAFKQPSELSGRDNGATHALAQYSAQLLQLEYVVTRDQRKDIEAQAPSARSWISVVFVDRKSAKADATAAQTFAKAVVNNPAKGIFVCAHVDDNRYDAIAHSWDANQAVHPIRRAMVKLGSHVMHDITDETGALFDVMKAQAQLFTTQAASYIYLPLGMGDHPFSAGGSGLAADQLEHLEISVTPSKQVNGLANASSTTIEYDLFIITHNTGTVGPRQMEADAMPDSQYSA